jgi:hypothetical protein
MGNALHLQVSLLFLTSPFYVSPIYNVSFTIHEWIYQYKKNQQKK